MTVMARVRRLWMVLRECYVAEAQFRACDAFGGMGDAARCRFQRLKSQATERSRQSNRSVTEELRRAVNEEAWRAVVARADTSEEGER